MSAAYSNVVGGKLNFKTKSKKKRAREEAEAAAREEWEALKAAEAAERAAEEGGARALEADAAAEGGDGEALDPEAAARAALEEEEGALWLTESERRARKQMKKIQKKHYLTKIAKQTHRDKVCNESRPRDRSIVVVVWSRAGEESLPRRASGATEKKKLPRVLTCRIVVVVMLWVAGGGVVFCDSAARAGREIQQRARRAHRAQRHSAHLRRRQRLSSRHRSFFLVESQRKRGSGSGVAAGLGAIQTDTRTKSSEQGADRI